MLFIMRVLWPSLAGVCSAYPAQMWSYQPIGNVYPLPTSFSSHKSVPNTSAAWRWFSVYFIKAAGNLEPAVWRMACLVPDSLFAVLLHHSNDNQFIHITGCWRQCNMPWQPGFFLQIYCLAYSTKAKKQPASWGIASLCDHPDFPLHPAWWGP